MSAEFREQTTAESKTQEKAAEGQAAIFRWEEQFLLATQIV